MEGLISDEEFVSQFTDILLQGYVGEVRDTVAQRDGTNHFIACGTRRESVCAVLV